jgi:hypothetical protein
MLRHRVRFYFGTGSDKNGRPIPPQYAEAGVKAVANIANRMFGGGFTMFDYSASQPGKVLEAITGELDEATYSSVARAIAGALDQQEVLVTVETVTLLKVRSDWDEPRKE